MRLPEDVRTLLRTQEPTRPRLTWYGPEPGERIELSGKVLDNWASKAANLLQEELDVTPGDRVTVNLPPGHWRALYWCMAAWCIGATVDTRRYDSQGNSLVLVGSGRRAAVASDGRGATGITVTLAPLARRCPHPLGADDIDEARQLATYADVFIPWDRPDRHAVALEGERGALNFDGLIHRLPHGTRWLLPATVSADVMARAALSAWAADGSIVVVGSSAVDDPAELTRLAGIESAELADAAELAGYRDLGGID